MRQPVICQGSSMKEGRFSFERGRGVVWVCDVESSSKHLNDDESVSAMEEFLPRLHWLGKVAVSAAGGCFVKWTGDGFLAWFPMALHRELAAKSQDVIEAIWHLTVMNNVTGLGVTERPRFHLRHGVTVEHDALITKISEEHGESIDLIGRSVVLAFRLAGIRAGFPNIVAQKEVVESVAAGAISSVNFRQLRLSTEDRTKYFKGERFGTRSLVVSADRKVRSRSLSSVVRSAKGTIERAEGDSSTETDTKVAVRLVRELRAGPQWAQGVLEEYVGFIREGLLGTLKGFVEQFDATRRRSQDPI